MRGSKCSSQTRLEGKLAIVTGANSGIGLETAKGLAYRGLVLICTEDRACHVAIKYSFNYMHVIKLCTGARVILACRDEEKAMKAIEDIKKTVGPICSVSFMKLDLASFKSVREFAEAFNKSLFGFTLKLSILQITSMCND